MIQKPMPIPIETFTQDLWEALRDEVRSQLGSAITADQFNIQFPTWEQLSDEARHQKIVIARDELLKPLDRAGYVVNRKKEVTA